MIKRLANSAKTIWSEKHMEDNNQLIVGVNLVTQQMLISCSIKSTLKARVNKITLKCTLNR